ncbi:MAG TPA: HEAT repeat domain-containing protein [Planctomycetota bacterium]|nr:HEAT repeat domain-containing protein [Planctomycetota bacterium]
MVQTLTAVCLLGALLAAGPAVAQTPEPAPDPDLPNLLKELKSLVSDRAMADDFQAIGLIQKLSKEPDKINPKDAEKIAKSLGDVFKTGKVRPPEKDILYRETADALSKFGAEGAKAIAKALGDNRFKDMIALQAHMILALGKTKDEKQVDWLLDTTTRSPHDELRGAAGEALGNYTSLAIRERRDVVKGIIREWGSLQSKATTLDSNDPNAPIDPGPQNARKTLQVVEGKWNNTLHKLTGVQNTQFTDWQRWLNKNPNWEPPEPSKAP